VQQILSNDAPCCLGQRHSIFLVALAITAGEAMAPAAAAQNAAAPVPQAPRAPAPLGQLCTTCHAEMRGPIPRLAILL